MNIENKIYEFTFIGTQGMSRSLLHSKIENFLNQESEVQNWKPGFFYKIARITETITKNKTYLIEVFGEFSKIPFKGTSSFKTEYEADYVFDLATGLSERKSK